MTKDSSNSGSSAAAEFDRPLLLTPAQDLAGYLLSRLGRAAIFLLTCTSVLAVALIFAFIVKEAWPFLAKYGVKEFLGSTAWYPEAEDKPVFGVLAIVVGSLYVTVGALLLAVPVALLAAMFLSDIVSFRFRQWIKPVIEILAAIPSVAYGFFAVIVVAPWMQDHLHVSTGTNILNASVILAVMAIPTIVSIAEDALTAAGRDLREGAYALGATRAECLVKVVMPAAHSGILAGVILGWMRAIGETMVVWMASGNATHIPAPWWDLTSSVRTLTATVAGEMGETPYGSDHYHALYAVGLLLLVFTLVLNSISEYFLARAKRAPGGKRR